jgi:FKBP12-rapamycin complex-associated protein
MEKYLKVLLEASLSEGVFYRAIFEIQQNQFQQARKSIEEARALVDTDLTALIGESYNRAYNTVVRVQQLAELEEVIEYRTTDSPERRITIKKNWKERLLGAKRSIDTW